MADIEIGGKKEKPIFGLCEAVVRLLRIVLRWLPEGAGIDRRRVGEAVGAASDRC
jgi:hypothetical protein